MSNWHYIKGGQLFGPVPAKQLKKMIDGGKLGPSDQVRAEGMSQWMSPADATSMLAEEGAPAEGQQPRSAGKKSPMLPIIIAIVALGTLGYALSTTDPFAPSEESLVADAQAYLESQLDEWIAGYPKGSIARAADLEFGNPLDRSSVPSLLDYEIKDARKSSAAVYYVTVILKFQSKAGTPLIMKHRYTVYRKREGWTIDP